MDLRIDFLENYAFIHTSFFILFYVGNYEKNYFGFQNLLENENSNTSNQALSLSLEFANFLFAKGKLEIYPFSLRHYFFENLEHYFLNFQ